MINLNLQDPLPLYEQIIQQIKELLAVGALEKGEKIPAVRELSAQLQINPNTVSKAYKELERQGILMVIRGRGTFISENIKQEMTKESALLVREKVKEAVLESIYANVTEQTLQQWVSEYYQTFKGRDGK
ncbi:GntR family transcriptional regulator [Alteribacillus iranensis]|uniref:GntR family transcriptional regulator n=1 Tax=Alteribacillus iranensis TaxID=930128 RepID=A0A1I2FMI4_9BACI|nr:GntR family transcriptional regulator [Alteribacillus iranensis]SFF06525.1 GntR family transcriptional regulator [Alteribacillus iranensis]